MNENRARIAGLRELMEKRGIDVSVIGPTNNMRYLLGGAPHPDERLCLFLVTHDRAQMIVPRLNADTVRSLTDVELLVWDDDEGPKRVLQSSLLHRRTVRRAAVDGSMRADFLMSLLSSKENIHPQSVDDMIGTLRMRKSAFEIDSLLHSAEQADRAMAAAASACRPNVTEREVAWEAEAAFRRDGAEEVVFTLVASGMNGAHPHHCSGEKKLKAGEGIIIDIGASLNGYKSDITRVVFLGKPSKEFSKVYDTVLEANKRARETVRKGISAYEVDRAARSVVEEAGYGEFFIHRTGHGIGLDIHEAPWIQQGSQARLDAGMVFSIEPGIYLPGRFGVRIEDIVAVTEKEVQVLTGFDHGLIEK